jgi:hypothetical protein
MQTNRVKLTGALALGGVLLARGAFATPPAPGQHFDCSDGGDTSCAANDEGCVPADKLAYKCSSVAGKIIAKAVKGATACHAKQADMRFKGASITGAGSSEENCQENPGKSVKSIFDAGVAKLSGIGCDAGFVSGVAAYGATLFGAGSGSFDGDNELVYCDSSSGAFIGDDDTGWVAATPEMLKCERAIAKGLAKLQATTSRCHTKMGAYFLKGADFNEEDCEEVAPGTAKGALERFNALRDKLTASGICPPCLSAAAMDSLAASTIAKEDANNDVAFPCP